MNPNPIPQFQDNDFIKSSRCAHPPGGCVEVAMKDGFVAVRDAKYPSQPSLLFTDTEWKVFVEGVKAGEFDA